MEAARRARQGELPKKNSTILRYPLECLEVRTKLIAAEFRPCLANPLRESFLRPGMPIAGTLQGNFDWRAFARMVIPAADRQLLPWNPELGLPLTFAQALDFHRVDPNPFKRHCARTSSRHVYAHFRSLHIYI